MARFQVKGVNDERDTCECCGKTGLKRVVWIEDTETNEIKCFGTTCAIQPAKGFDCQKEIKTAVNRAVRDARDRQQAIWTFAYKAYRKAGGSWIKTDDGEKQTQPELYAECLKMAEEHRAKYESWFAYYRAK